MLYFYFVLLQNFFQSFINTAVFGTQLRDCTWRDSIDCVDTSMQVPRNPFCYWNLGIFQRQPHTVTAIVFIALAPTSLGPDHMQAIYFPHICHSDTHLLVPISGVRTYATHSKLMLLIALFIYHFLLFQCLELIKNGWEEKKSNLNLAFFTRSLYWWQRKYFLGTRVIKQYEFH